MVEQCLNKVATLSTQPSILSKDEAHVRPSCKSAENSNIFTGKPCLVIKKIFMAPFYRRASKVFHSVPKSFWYSFDQPGKEERLLDLRATLWFLTWDLEWKSSTLKILNL